MANQIADKLKLVNCPENKKDVALKFAASLSLVSYEEMEEIVNYLLEKGIITKTDDKISLPPKAFKILPRGIDYIKEKVAEMEELGELDCYKEDPSRINIVDANLRLTYMKNAGEEYRNEKGKYSNLPFDRTEFIKKYGDIDLTDTNSLQNESSEDVVDFDAEVPVVEETPVEETPVEEVQLEETPVEESNTEEVSLAEVELPVVEDVPVAEVPVEETPVEEAPVEETPVEETPVEEIPVEDDHSTISATELKETVAPAVVEELPDEIKDDSIGITTDEEEVNGTLEVDPSIIDFAKEAVKEEMVDEVPIKEEVVENTELTVEPKEAEAEVPVGEVEDEGEQLNTISINSESISTKVLENQARFENLSTILENLYAGLFNIEEVPSAMFDILRRFIEETTYEDADLLFQLLTGGSSYTPEEQGKIREAIEEQIAIIKPKEAA